MTVSGFQLLFFVMKTLDGNYFIILGSIFLIFLGRAVQFENSGQNLAKSGI